MTAILSADVKGYSRLMGEDEDGTVRTLATYRQVMSDFIRKHQGRVVDSPGDNILAEFGSVVDAVRGAVEIQVALGARNAELPENRRMEFRIGINLGDVIVDGDRIYGDGVNIAARVEGVAEGGGLCISGTVYDQVENKLAFEYDYLGEQAVKNIKKPVRVYRLRMVADATSGGVNRGPSLPDRPSIAVLPFVNMSGDPEQEYFSDGMTEDLITDLSKISGLFVIARNSVFTYKGKAVKVDQVGQDLGVRHVLEGSVRKAGGRVRITAQLVDARTGGHLWAERYDRDLEDIFALQDEVVQKIVAVLAVKLTEDEQDRLERRYTDNLEAYDYYLRGLEYFHRFTREENSQARSMFRSAIDLDPTFAVAYSLLSLTHWLEWSFGWSQDLGCLEIAFELAQKATALDDTLPEPHGVLGMVYLWKKEHEKAIGELQWSIALDPNYAEAMNHLAHVLSFAGKPEEAIRWAKKAMRLNPIYSAFYLWPLGHAYFLLDQYEDAVATFRRILHLSPNFHPAHIYLALSLGGLGRDDEARREAAAFVKMTPNMSWEAWRQRLPYKDQSVLDGLFEAARKVGLKPW